MTNTISSQPIDFDLYDEEDQQVLFITDDIAGQDLTFEITNTSDKPVSPKLLNGNASRLNYHFELVFRSATLYNVQPAITINDTRFDLFMDKENGNIKANPDGTLSLFFYSKGSWTLRKGEKLLITISKIRAEATNGTRGTRVMLRCQNLLHAGNNIPFSGIKEMHLNIVNHRGKKNIPLNVGFVGSNMILNNGNASNTLKLRISNASRKDTVIESSAGSKLILSMEGGTPVQEWTIATDGQVNATQVSYKRPGDQNLIEAAAAPAWEIPFVTLRKGEFIDVQIANLVTGHPAGHTNLFLHYENIPGYWDGEIAAIVEREPLAFLSNRVGIGTTNPYFKLDVLGVIGLRKDGAPWDHMFLHHDGAAGYVSAGGAEDGLVLRVGSVNSGTYTEQPYPEMMRLRPNGDVQLGPAQNPATGTLHLYSGGAETLTIKAGKLGIGNANPATAKLVITGRSEEEGLDLSSANQYANARVLRNSLSPIDKDMYIGYQSGTNSSLHLFSNNNETLTIKAGKVGIGNTAPTTAKLVITGGWGEEGLDLASTDQYANARVIRNSLSTIDKDMYIGFQSGANSSLHLFSNNTETVTVKNNKAGIGITEPYFSLDVKGRIGLRNEAPWDHMFLHHDGVSGFITAGGAEGGLAFRVGNGGSNGYEGQSYPEVARLMPNGRMGINNSNPGYPLHVSGSVNYDLGGGFYFMFKNESRQAGSGSHVNSITIKADAGIESSLGLYCTSDKRIKKGIQQADPFAALDCLKKLDVVDYQYIDFVTLGDKKSKGFIAQDIAAIFPEAVAKRPGFIPDIYNIPEATRLENGHLVLTMKDAHNLVPGDVVRLAGKEADFFEAAIQVVDEKTFKVQNWSGSPDHVFVYGKQVEDFMTLDYDYIFCAGIGATQALSKQVDELNARLNIQEVKVQEMEESIKGRMMPS
ncbi:Chaperone of endosialidase [Chitinophaga sp. CF118]|uniref:tail fiber domain-containing protein n=1 Tax=Chitinophaga sp. CF118 TaxID=1884367 RepID=UPI0008F2523C|nr:tail fiber domain-containing protein [Chitinophaga sp. CF118]SFD86777.1 Chaperone of endosialidase [Chitinophaga sp. CF118]